MQEKLLKEYVKLEARFKELEQDRQELRSKILSAMQESRLEKVESVWGSFTVAARQTWKYSKAVDKIAEQLALRKAQEVKKGIATVENETAYVVFKPVIKE